MFVIIDVRVFCLQGLCAKKETLWDYIHDQENVVEWLLLCRHQMRNNMIINVHACS